MRPGKMERCLQEFRVRGVKTNIPFLLNLVVHPGFLDGVGDDPKFLDETPDLFKHVHPAGPRDEAAQSYLSDVIVNGHPEVKGQGSGAPRSGRGCFSPPLVEGRSPRSGGRGVFAFLSGNSPPGCCATDLPSTRGGVPRPPAPATPSSKLGADEASPSGSASSRNCS